MTLGYIQRNNGAQSEYLEAETIGHRTSESFDTIRDLTLPTGFKVLVKIISHYLSFSYDSQAIRLSIDKVLNCKDCNLYNIKCIKVRLLLFHKTPKLWCFLLANCSCTLIHNEEITWDQRSIIMLRTLLRILCFDSTYYLKFLNME